jgi:hypothetical protein
MRNNGSHRRKGTLSCAAVTAYASVHIIDPNGIYFVDDARSLLRLRASTIRREVREGRLRIAKRAGRYYVLGAWLIQWIQEGELRHRNRDGAGLGTDNA